MRHAGAHALCARVKRTASENVSIRQSRRLLTNDHDVSVLGETVQSLAEWTEDELHAVSEYYFAELDEPTRTFSAQISLLNQELDRLSKDGDIVIISQEAPTLT